MTLEYKIGPKARGGALLAHTYSHRADVRILLESKDALWSRLGRSPSFEPAAAGRGTNPTRDRGPKGVPVAQPPRLGRRIDAPPEHRGRVPFSPPSPAPYHDMVLTAKHRHRATVAGS